MSIGLCHLRDYLSNRRQRVSCNGNVSEWNDISSGVPQGSVLGPILFVVNMYDLTPTVPQLRYFKYADDLTVLHTVRCNNFDALSHDLAHIMEWCGRNNMLINASKTQLMTFGKRSHITSRLLDQVVCGSSTIAESDVIKLLGLTIQRDLRWNNHIDITVKRCSKAMFGLRLLKRAGINSTTLIRYYEAIIRSVISYAFPAFCSAGMLQLRRLSRIENWAFRIIGCQPGVKLDCFLMGVCKSLFNQVTRCETHPLRELFETRTCVRTRQDNVFRHPVCRTTRLANSFIRFVNQ